MEQTVTREKVQSAMNNLRVQGERVSRRNVLQLTGGGMSTVHKLMSEIENLEDLQSLAPKEGITETLHKALLQEIGTQVKQATAILEKKTIVLKSREAEILEALSGAESDRDRLAKELEFITSQADQQKLEADTAHAVSEETIYRLEENVIKLHEERNCLNETIEVLKIDAAKSKHQVELAEQMSGKAENTIAQLQLEIQKLQKGNLEIDKRAAASAQKAADLREALAKAEKRIKFLEQRMEIGSKG